MQVKYTNMQTTNSLEVLSGNNDCSSCNVAINQLNFRSQLHCIFSNELTMACTQWRQTQVCLKNKIINYKYNNSNNNSQFSSQFTTRWVVHTCKIFHASGGLVQMTRDISFNYQIYVTDSMNYRYRRNHIFAIQID